MGANFKRVKEFLNESSVQMNEAAQIRDAKPALEQLMNAVPQVQESVVGALNATAQVEAAAKQALEAISGARQTAASIGVEQNAIIDNINAAQQADPSQSIITLTDHRSGVQQAYNILSTIVTTLTTANSLCGQLNALASKQFL